jgi:hypothetical protein
MILLISKPLSLRINNILVTLFNMTHLGLSASSKRQKPARMNLCGSGLIAQGVQDLGLAVKSPLGLNEWRGRCLTALTLLNSIGGSAHGPDSKNQPTRSHPGAAGVLVDHGHSLGWVTDLDRDHSPSIE